MTIPGQTTLERRDSTSTDLLEFGKLACHHPHHLLFTPVLHVHLVFVGEPDAQAVVAPVNEDVNDEDDEAVEENALAESAAKEKKAAKAVAKQQKVTWIGNSQTSADGKQMYMCVNALTRSLIHSLTCSFIYSLVYSLTQSFTHSPTYPLTHQPSL